jgi:hypothetical protein
MMIVHGVDFIAFESRTKSEKVMVKKLGTQNNLYGQITLLEGKRPILFQFFNKNPLCTSKSIILIIVSSKFAKLIRNAFIVAIYDSKHSKADLPSWFC